MGLSSTNDEIETRLSEGCDRLYSLDFFGRSWLAVYVADVGTMLTERDELRAEVERLRAEISRLRAYDQGFVP